MASLYNKLVCSKTGETYDIKTLQNFSRAGKPLLAGYDLTQKVNRDTLKDRPANMWRYREMLPVFDDKNIVTLQEGMTPLYKLEKLGKKYGIDLIIKDEAFNPTGSFKARGLGMAISKAKELGVTKCVIPTAGNAGGAMSAYCALAGMEAHVFMPRVTPSVFRKECELYGAKVTLVDGSIRDCGKMVAEKRANDWFDVSTLKEPFRIEGKKTMGYEIAEQLNWRVPDVIVYPTGGGTGLIGIWKAFAEMEALGWVGSKRPRMVAVQGSGCNPIIKAFNAGKAEAEVYENPDETIANGLRVPGAFGDALILKALYESKGTAIDVTEDEIRDGLSEVAGAEGVLLAPEGAAVWIAIKKLQAQKWISSGEQVLLMNTGSLYKYMENL
jgi:threonine synthase